MTRSRSETKYVGGPSEPVPEGGSHVADDALSVESSGTTSPAGGVTAPVPTQAYADRAQTIAASDRFLASESGRLLRSMGADLIIGAREGARFQDAYTKKWYWNMHCNGGVFNMGHRNPRLLRALR